MSEEIGDFKFNPFLGHYEYKIGSRTFQIRIERAIEEDRHIGWAAKGKHSPKHFLNAIQFHENIWFVPEEFKTLCAEVCYRHTVRLNLFARYTTVLIVGNQFERITGQYDPNGFNEVRESAYKDAMFPWNRSASLVKVRNDPLTKPSAWMAIPGVDADSKFPVPAPGMPKEMEKHLRIKIEIPKHIELLSPVDSRPIKILWSGETTLVIGNNVYKPAEETEENHVFYVHKSDIDLLKKVRDENRNAP